jgi:hypothetical protein
MLRSAATTKANAQKVRPTHVDAKPEPKNQPLRSGPWPVRPPLGRENDWKTHPDTLI